jgi:ABC-type sugar transport system ATPase subunit
MSRQWTSGQRSEADGLASLCDRILVFYCGQITAVLTAPGSDQHAALEATNTAQIAMRDDCQ